MQSNQEKVRQDLLRICQETCADEITLIIFGETYSRGHDTLEELEDWLDLIRPWKETLQAAGIAVSLNPWTTILHCDRGRKLKDTQNWQTMVDWKGRAASAVACPLDPGWRDYVRKALDLYAREGFRVIWLDDDFRLANHAPLDWGGCFCPRHVAEFNRRAGTDASREEILAALMRPGTPHPWREIWLEMWDVTQTDLLASFRQVVERRGGQLGLMSSGPMMSAMEGRRWPRWWQALSGDNPPVHRPHFTGYADSIGTGLVLGIHMLDMNRVLEREDTEIAPEIENFPHGWSKSFRQTSAHMVMAQVFGAHRLNLSLYDYLGNSAEDQPEIGRFLAGWKPTLDWLADLFPASLTSQGIGCPWSEEQVRRKQARAGAKTFMESLFVPTHGWPTWLGNFGHAFQMRISKEVNAIAGDMAWAFDDEQILDMLAKGLLLDGPAAANLEQRGFARFVGLQDIHFFSQAELLYSMEELTDADFTIRQGALVSMDDKPCTQQLAQGVLLPEARQISVLRAPRFELVGHGVVIYENALGGRVAVCPWDANAPETFSGQRTIYRAGQIEALIRYLSGGSEQGLVSGSPWLACQFLGDGERQRGVIWNAGPDPVYQFDFYPPAGSPTILAAVQLDMFGNRTPTALVGDRIILNSPLQQWECVIVVFEDKSQASEHLLEVIS
jgi:hypothetical protein